ncbi:glutamate racemase [Isachenkonia alkalipeptolytica]|uniref:Glutamate racemase n=1 Tax=Isachenkonia alkalipeptolytica TaxID=2565777 RepID=A0AA43XMD6_9CLOT|nr:glutamate racemase [Isachenkonia alkalipeptolytica]NBG89498.1 glutamate racemase [Isachenkonia alkalipeptolytica]
MIKPIGVFDSGLGGISVLAQMITTLPEERYLYFGDSKNAPYGEKTREEVLYYSKSVAQKLLDQNAKAMVVACNTATSAAISDLRSLYNIPIIGMEPAVKPAVNMENIHRVVVMATPFTLREEKFHELVRNIDTNKEILKLPCPGLVQLIEQEGGVGAKVLEYLRKLLGKASIGKGDVIVLGCTHYVFLTDTIKQMLNNQVPLVHGNIGTVLQLKNQLKKHQLILGKKNASINQNFDKKNKLLISKSHLKTRVQILNSHQDPGFNPTGWNLLMYELNKIFKEK